MTVETIRQFIQWTFKFHQQLSICMLSCAKKNTDSRANMLLQYIAQHEQQLADVLDSFTEADFNNELNTWVNEYFQKSPLREHQHECQDEYANINSASVLSRYVEKSNYVIDLYKMLTLKAETPSTEALLMQLTSLQEQHLKQIVQSSNRMTEI